MSEPVRHKSLLRFGLIFVAGLLLAWLGYIFAVNAFLASSLAMRLMNSSPNDAGVSYDSARSYFPFRVSVRNLKLNVEDSNVQVYVSADWAQCDVSLLGIVRKGAYLSRVRGDGLILRIRQQLLPHDLARDKITKLPDIPGFPSPLKTHPNMPVTDAHYDMVTVSLTDIDVTNLREVWIDEYRFEGHIDIHGGFFYKPLRLLRLDASTINIVEGTLHFGEPAVAKNIRAKINVKVPTINVENLKRDALRGFDADIDLKTDISSVEFLNFYLKDVPMVRLEEGAGSLAVKLKMEKGLIKKGSEINLDSKRVTVRMPYFFASGAAAIRWLADNQKAKLNVALKDIAITQESDQKIVLSGPQFNVLANSTGLDVAKPLDLDVVLDLPEGDAKDLSFLNEYIPPGAGVRIDKGSGVIQGNLEISAKAQHAQGALSIKAKDIVVQNKGARLSGRLDLEGVLKDLDLKTNETDLSGSRFALDDVTVAMDNAQKDTNFWLRLDVEHCKLIPKNAPKKSELRWQTKINLAMKNLQPIMHIISANLTVPWVAQAFSNWSDIKAHTELTVREKSITLRDLYAESGALHVKGNLEIKEIPGKAKPPLQQPFGSVLVELGQLKIGIDLEGQKTSAVLFGADKWFEAQKTAH